MLSDIIYCSFCDDKPMPNCTVLTFVEFFQIVTDVEEADLARQLEKAEEENREVAGDDDEEDEEVGMGELDVDSDEEKETEEKKEEADEE